MEEHSFLYLRRREKVWQEDLKKVFLRVFCAGLGFQITALSCLLGQTKFHSE